MSETFRQVDTFYLYEICVHDGCLYVRSGSSNGDIFKHPLDYGNDQISFGERVLSNHSEECNNIHGIA